MNEARRDFIRSAVNTKDSAKLLTVPAYELIEFMTLVVDGEETLPEGKDYNAYTLEDMREVIEYYKRNPIPK